MSAGAASSAQSIHFLSSAAAASRSARNAASASARAPASASRIAPSCAAAAAVVAAAAVAVVVVCDGRDERQMLQPDHQLYDRRGRCYSPRPQRHERLDRQQQL